MHFLGPLLLELIVLLVLFEEISAFHADRIAATKKKVDEAFDHAYEHFWTLGLPFDELDPCSCRGLGYGAPQSHLPGTDSADVKPTVVQIQIKESNFSEERFEILGGYCLTLIDSLDTLVLMGKIEKFKESVAYLADRQKDFFKLDHKVIVFEVVIRVLGGLLSGHLLAVDEHRQFRMHPELNKSEAKGWYKGELLEMAVDLAKRLLPAFCQSPSVLPFTRVNLATGHCGQSSRDTLTNIASAGTLLLEFSCLSDLTGDDIYQNLALKSSLNILGARSKNLQLVPSTFNVTSGFPYSSDAGIGASNDSFYEYLLKGAQYFLQRGDSTTSSKLWQGFHTIYPPILEHIRSMKNELLYFPVNIYTGFPVSFYIDSLAAFFPGLQVMKGDLRNALRHYTFYLTQFLWFDGLTMERFNTKYPLKSHFAYFLRPEFIESTYHLYRALKWPIFLE